jgi:hypothetical protein
MARVLRRLGAAALLGALAGCGVVTGGGQTAPPPATPVQKATASPENPDSIILAEFNARLDRYVTLQRRLAAESPDLEETANPAEIAAAQDVLAAKIRAVRQHARQGDIFPPQVAALFRRLMYPELQGASGRETRGNILDEPATAPLQVNARYPSTQPLPTVPPNVLANLPQLPEDVEYRIVGRHLLLRDVDANIIVDYIPNAIR